MFELHVHTYVSMYSHLYAFHRSLLRSVCGLVAFHDAINTHTLTNTHMFILHVDTCSHLYAFHRSLLRSVCGLVAFQQSIMIPALVYVPVYGEGFFCSQYFDFRTSSFSVYFAADMSADSVNVYLCVCVCVWRH